MISLSNAARTSGSVGRKYGWLTVTIPLRSIFRRLGTLEWDVEMSETVDETYL